MFTVTRHPVVVVAIDQVATRSAATTRLPSVSGWSGTVCLRRLWPY